MNTHHIAIAEGDGFATFDLVTNGFSGEEWIAHFDSIGVSFCESLEPNAKNVLLSTGFQPTAANVDFKVAVFRGTFFGDSDRTSEKLRTLLGERGYVHGSELPAEIACLIRRNFADAEIREQLGVRDVVVLHEPIVDEDHSFLLGTHSTSGGPYMVTYSGKSDFRWTHDYGFAVLAR